MALGVGDQLDRGDAARAGLEHVDDRELAVAQPDGAGPAVDERGRGADGAAHEAPDRLCAVGLGRRRRSGRRARRRAGRRRGRARPRAPGSRRCARRRGRRRRARPGARGRPRGRCSTRRTRERARLASWRVAAGLRSTIGAISSNGIPNTSCSTKATRSAGGSVSSTTSSASPTASLTSASSSRALVGDLDGVLAPAAAGRCAPGACSGTRARRPCSARRRGSRRRCVSVRLKRSHVSWTASSASLGGAEDALGDRAQPAAGGPRSSSRHIPSLARRSWEHDNPHLGHRRHRNARQARGRAAARRRRAGRASSIAANGTSRPARAWPRPSRGSRRSSTAPAPRRATARRPARWSPPRATRSTSCSSRSSAPTACRCARGLDRAMFGYFASKLDAERAVIESGIPYTILRATQFHELILMTVRGMSKLPLIPVPGFRFQPVDADEVAARLVRAGAGFAGGARARSGRAAGLHAQGAAARLPAGRAASTGRWSACRCPAAPRARTGKARTWHPTEPSATAPGRSSWPRRR